MGEKEMKHKSFIWDNRKTISDSIIKFSLGLIVGGILITAIKRVVVAWL